MRRKTRSTADAVFLQKVGSRLRMFRRRRGLSQSEFAELLDLSREGYANYERGQREMGITVARRVRQKMDIDLLVHDRDADPVEECSMLRQAGATKPGWVKAPLRLRARIIARRAAFDLETFSACRRRLHSVREIAFSSATIMTALRLLAPDFGLHGVAAAAQIDWALLLGFTIMSCLLPFQALYFGRFIYWMRSASR